MASDTKWQNNHNWQRSQFMMEYDSTKAQVFRKSTFFQIQPQNKKNKRGSTICFSHKNGCFLSSSVNWKKISNIPDSYCCRTWSSCSSVVQSMLSRLISTDVSRISFAGWKKATTNHASHQRALVLPIGELCHNSCVLEIPIISLITA